MDTTNVTYRENNGSSEDEEVPVSEWSYIMKTGPGNGPATLLKDWLLFRGENLVITYYP